MLCFAFLCVLRSTLLLLCSCFALALLLLWFCLAFTCAVLCIALLCYAMLCFASHSKEYKTFLRFPFRVKRGLLFKMLAWAQNFFWEFACGATVLDFQKGLHELRNISEKLNFCIIFSMSSIGALWSCLKLSEALWNFLKLSEALWSSVKLSDTLSGSEVHRLSLHIPPPPPPFPPSL